MSLAGAVEVVDFGVDRAPRRWPLAVVGVIAALVIGLFVLDSRATTREYDELFGKASATEATISITDRRVAGLRQYAGPWLYGAQSPASLRAAIAALLQGERSEGVARLHEHRAAIEASSIRPWHDDNRRLRTAVLAYLDAAVTRLDAPFDSSRRMDELDRKADLEDALRAAAPDSGRRADAVAVFG